MDATIKWNGNKIEELVAINIGIGMDSGIATSVGRGMKALDGILELMEDSEWHSLDEIKAQIPLPDVQFAPILCFFADFGFITLDGERSVAKIKPSGLTFLELPVE